MKTAFKRVFKTNTSWVIQWFHDSWPRQTLRYRKRSTLSQTLCTVLLSYTLTQRKRKTERKKKTSLSIWWYVFRYKFSCTGDAVRHYQHREHSNSILLKSQCFTVSSQPNLAVSHSVTLYLVKPLRTAWPPCDLCHPCMHVVGTAFQNTKQASDTALNSSNKFWCICAKEHTTVLLLS